MLNVPNQQEFMVLRFSRDSSVMFRDIFGARGKELSSIGESVPSMMERLEPWAPFATDSCFLDEVKATPNLTTPG